MQAITFTTPVHSLQVLMSILQTRLRRFAQVIDARRSTGDGRSSTCYSCLRDKSYLTWEQVIHLYGYVDLWGHLLLRLSAPPKRWIRVTVPVLAAW